MGPGTNCALHPHLALDTSPAIDRLGGPLDIWGLSFSLCDMGPCAGSERPCPPAAVAGDAAAPHGPLRGGRGAPPRGRASDPAATALLQLWSVGTEGETRPSELRGAGTAGGPPRRERALSSREGRR